MCPNFSVFCIQIIWRSKNLRKIKLFSFTLDNTIEEIIIWNSDQKYTYFEHVYVCIFNENVNFIHARLVSQGKNYLYVKMKLENGKS